MKPLIITTMLWLLAITPSLADIHIGSSVPLSGASESLGRKYMGGATLYFNAHNSKNTDPERVIRHTIYDDAYNPEKTLRNTLVLTKTDKVDALFGYVGTPTVVRILPLLKLHEASNLKLYFPFTGAKTLRTPPYTEFVYNLRAAYHQEISGLTRELSKIGRNRIALFYQSDAYGRDGWFGLQRAAEKWGASMVADVSYRRGMRASADFSEQVNLVKNNNPDAIICVGSYEAIAGFIKGIREQGVDIPVASISFVNADALLRYLPQNTTTTAYRDNLIMSQVVPSYKSDLPAAKEFRAAVREANNESLLNEVAFEGYLAAKLFTKMVFSNRKNGFGIGLAQPIQFDAKNNSLNEVTFQEYQDNAWQSVKEWSKWQQ